MIVFDLDCDAQHRFECWFRSSDDFEKQRQAEMIACPMCGSSAVAKAPMAPAVPAKANRSSAAAADSLMSRSADGAGKQFAAHQQATPEFISALAKIATAQAKALATSKWVGDNFAERSRAMHYGEAEVEQIHGRATGEQARSLVEEGVAVLPLIVLVVPPEEAH